MSQPTGPNQWQPYGQPTYQQPGQPNPGFSQQQFGYSRPVYPTGQPYLPAGYLPPVTRKEPAISLLVSFFLPGVGSMMNGETNKGVGILVGYIVCVFLFWLIVPAIAAVGLWVWGMVDAYQGAQRFNMAHGLMP